MSVPKERELRQGRPSTLKGNLSQHPTKGENYHLTYGAGDEQKTYVEAERVKGYA